MKYRLKQFLYIDPIKQGLKHQSIGNHLQRITVFIHRSNKTRIETTEEDLMLDIPDNVFIHRSNKTRIETNKNGDEINIETLFLYIDPIKQGLKLSLDMADISSYLVFIHRSNKTRIETTRKAKNRKGC